MEKIRSFMENMFLGLPDTQEVRDAKARLLEGMSDRYEELLAQGKDPDAAFGISVAEFGSMEELRRELSGSASAPMAAPQPQPCLDEAARREYEAFQRQYPIAIAAGVALCILALAASMFLDRWMGEMGGNVPHVAFLTIIAMAVCIFIYFGIKREQYQRAFDAGDPSQRERRGGDDPVKGAIMLGATCIYLFLGFTKDLWHPGWIVFPAGASLCLLADVFWPRNKG